MIPITLAGASPAPSPQSADVITDPQFYLVSVVAVILLGLSKGGFFGLGVISLPLMSLFVPPLQAAAILIPTVMAQDTLTVWTYRRDWSAWNLKVMLPGMAIGIFIGTLLAAAFVLRHWLGQRFERLASRSNAATGVAFGALGGFTTLLANAGGPAWQMHLLPQKLEKFTYAGTLTMLFAVSNLMKLPAYGALGQITLDNMLVGALLLPAALLANYAGLWLVRRTPTELFFRIAYVLMLLIAIELIRGAVVEMARS